MQIEVPPTIPLSLISMRPLLRMAPIPLAPNSQDATPA